MSVDPHIQETLKTIWEERSLERDRLRAEKLSILARGGRPGMDSIKEEVKKEDKQI